MKTLLTFISLFFFFSLSAQKHNKYTSLVADKSQAKRFLREVLLRPDAGNSPAAKTTVTRERLTRQADYVSPRMLYDSMAFKYSGSRGSSYSPDLIFLTGIGPQASSIGNDIYGYINTNGMPITHNEAPLVLCDTAKMWAMTSSLTFGYFGTENFTYDPSNNLLDVFFMGDSTQNILWQRQISTYNSSGNIATEYTLVNNYTGGTLPLDTGYLDVFTYNSSGKMTIDSESDYNNSTLACQPSVKYTYSYDVAGNMTLAQGWNWNFPGWQLGTSYTMTYNSANQLKTYHYDVYAPGPEPYYIDSFGYTAGASYFTYVMQKDYTSAGLTDSGIGKRNVNSFGLPDTVESYTCWPSGLIIDHLLGVTVYNSYHDPVKFTSYEDTTSVMPTAYYGETDYYYETYSGSAVTNIPNDFNLQVYPNPVVNTLSISYPDFTKNATITIELSNLTGQKVRREVIRWQNETEQIFIGDLVPGLYLITIQNGNCRTHSGKVLKL